MLNAKYNYLLKINPKIEQNEKRWKIQQTVVCSAKANSIIDQLQKRSEVEKCGAFDDEEFTLKFAHANHKSAAAPANVRAVYTRLRKSYVELEEREEWEKRPTKMRLRLRRDCSLSVKVLGYFCGRNFLGWFRLEWWILAFLIGVFRANMARNLNSWDLKISDNYSVRWIARAKWTFFLHKSKEESQ